jgi:hypothetical protein
MTTLEVLFGVQERGLVLSARGDQLAVGPNRLLSTEFAGRPREFKRALSPLLWTKDVMWIEAYWSGSARRSSSVNKSRFEANGTRIADGAAKCADLRRSEFCHKHNLAPGTL